jgi:hypothetical protein
LLRCRRFLFLIQNKTKQKAVFIANYLKFLLIDCLDLRQIIIAVNFTPGFAKRGFGK